MLFVQPICSLPARYQRLTQQTKLLASVLLSLLMVGCGSTPSQPALIEAINSGDTERAQRLIASGANPDTTDSVANTALAKAAARNNHSIVDALLAAGADINQVSNTGWSALHQAVRYEGDLELIEKLLDRGANLNAPASSGWTVLHMAARYRDVPMAHYLVEAGADPHALTNAKASTLYLALHAGNAEMVDFLLSLGVSIDSVDNNGVTIRQKADEMPGYSAAMLEQSYAFYTRQRQMQQVQQRIEALTARDAALPVAIRRDKYLVAFSNAMKELQYADADFYARMLERTGLPVDDSLYYFWGEALLELGEADDALNKLATYLNRAGNTGQYYAQTLSLMLEAESR